MVITVDNELEAALTEQARLRGIAAADLALDALREQFLTPQSSAMAQDEWERRLLGLSKNCGVSLSDTVLSRETLYE
ncbi:MAG: hypothetical protein Q8K78_03120 [Planctomycetaceae bacterium]|nr:hypothetical protein [Planctomycetaceae bacterium]